MLLTKHSHVAAADTSMAVHPAIPQTHFQEWLKEYSRGRARTSNSLGCYALNVPNPQEPKSSLPVLGAVDVIVLIVTMIVFVKFWCVNWLHNKNRASVKPQSPLRAVILT